MKFLKNVLPWALGVCLATVLYFNLHVLIVSIAAFLFGYFLRNNIFSYKVNVLMNKLNKNVEEYNKTVSNMHFLRNQLEDAAHTYELNLGLINQDKNMLIERVDWLESELRAKSKNDNLPDNVFENMPTEAIPMNVEEIIQVAPKPKRKSNKKKPA